MDYGTANEEMLKAQEYERQAKLNNASAATQCGMAGNDPGEAMMDSLPNRVESQLHRARRESRKAVQLQELAELLKKHPDVARILDLTRNLDR